MAAIEKTDFILCVTGQRCRTVRAESGSGTSTIVRGRGSINASTEPLFVLDGVPVGSGNLSADSNNAVGFKIVDRGYRFLLSWLRTSLTAASSCGSAPLIRSLKVFLT